MRLARAEGSSGTSLNRPKSSSCRTADRRRVPGFLKGRASTDCTNCEPTTRFQTGSFPSSSANPTPTSLPPGNGASPARPVVHSDALPLAAVRALERRRAATPTRKIDSNASVCRERQAASKGLEEEAAAAAHSREGNRWTCRGGNRRRDWRSGRGGGRRNDGELTKETTLFADVRLLARSHRPQEGRETRNAKPSTMSSLPSTEGDFRQAASSRSPKEQGFDRLLSMEGCDGTSARMTAGPTRAI